MTLGWPRISFPNVYVLYPTCMNGYIYTKFGYKLQFTYVRFETIRVGNISNKWTFYRGRRRGVKVFRNKWNINHFHMNYICMLIKYCSAPPEYVRITRIWPNYPILSHTHANKRHIHTYIYTNIIKNMLTIFGVDARRISWKYAISSGRCRTPH